MQVSHARRAARTPRLPTHAFYLCLSCSDLCADALCKSHLPLSRSQDTWRDDAHAGEVHLAGLTAQHRRVADQMAMLRVELDALDNEIAKKRRELAARPPYAPSAEPKEHAEHVASLVLPAGRLPRDFQIAAACALHEGRDVFVVYGAGTGKSMCYIIAGLMRPPPSLSLQYNEKAKLTVVVTPLIALGHEQVASINAKPMTCVADDGTHLERAYLLGGDDDHLIDELEGAALPTHAELVARLTSARITARMAQLGGAEAIDEAEQAEAPMASDELYRL